MNRDGSQSRNVRRMRPGRGPGIALWVFLDVCVASVAMLVAFALSPAYGGLSAGAASTHATPFQATLVYAVLLPLVAHILGLHGLGSDRAELHWAWRTLLAVALAVSGTVLFFFGLFYAMIGRWIVVQAAFYAFAFKFGTRLVLARFVLEQPRRLLLLGSPDVENFLQGLIKQRHAPLCLVHVICPVFQSPAEAQDGPADAEMAELLRRVVDEGNVDEIIDGLRAGPWPQTRAELQRCLAGGVSISTLANFVERYFMFVPVEYIDAEWFLHANIEFGHPYYAVLKRFLDLSIATIGLAVAFPLLLLAALAIKIESRGPVLYSQLRTGLFNRPFRMWKLRTMKANAEEDGPQWAKQGDSRVTRVGWLLRRIRLDEVPQFWNVIRGEMSIVGPRPERPELIAQLKLEIPFFQERHLVPPGLTGWAQINLPYGGSVEDSRRKLSYDLYYIKHASLVLDLHIMLRTVASLMKGSR